MRDPRLTAGDRDYVAKIRWNRRAAQRRASLHLKMQVRNERSSRVSTTPDLCAGGNEIALPNANAPRLQVRADRIQPGRMRDDNGVAPVVARVDLADWIVGDAVDHLIDGAGSRRENRQSITPVVTKLAALAVVRLAVRTGGLEIKRVPPLTLVCMRAAVSLRHDPIAAERQSKRQPRELAESSHAHQVTLERALRTIGKRRRRGPTVVLAHPHRRQKNLRRRDERQREDRQKQQPCRRKHGIRDRARDRRAGRAQGDRGGMRHEPDAAQRH